MTNRTLRDCRILIAEDEYMLASDLEMELLNARAIVLGPFGTVETTLGFIRTKQEIDAAILDVNLRGELIFPAADLLIECGVPFVLTTGYDASVIPSRFERCVLCQKPISMVNIIQVIQRLIHV